MGLLFESVSDWMGSDGEWNGDREGSELMGLWLWHGLKEDWIEHQVWIVWFSSLFEIREQNRWRLGLNDSGLRYNGLWTESRILNWWCCLRSLRLNGWYLKEGTTVWSRDRGVDVWSCFRLRDDVISDWIWKQGWKATGNDYEVLWAIRSKRRNGFSDIWKEIG